jgi:hypothetical protein
MPEELVLASVLAPELRSALESVSGSVLAPELRSGLESHSVSVWPKG